MLQEDEILPLDGVRVVEFAHMVMGPSCGLVLADLGAEVIKVEPLAGDNTRRLEAAGAGFFPVFNRNKKSLAVDLARPEGKDIALRLLDTADVLTENFRPGALDKLGFSYEALKGRNQRLIYCSLKGFLKGPYEHRPALDEVTQMMGGLAYMTGLPGRPLRAGTSVNDIMGGMFAAIGANGMPIASSFAASSAWGYFFVISLIRGTSQARSLTRMPLVLSRSSFPSDSSLNSRQKTCHCVSVTTPTNRRPPPAVSKMS